MNETKQLINEINWNLRVSGVLGVLRKAMMCILLCGFMVVNVQADADSDASRKLEPLRLGLIPHLSTNMMMKKYHNLIVYLEDKLNRRVFINTAPNFKSYVERCAKGEFDLYMTAPHMAIYHEKYNQHVRLVKFSNELRAVVTVREDSKYKKISDLNGKVVSAPDSLAVNTINGELVFQDDGLDINKDVNIKHTTSNNNPLFLLSDGKVDAAITGLPGYKMVRKSGRLKIPLRVLKKSKAIPHMMFLSPPGVSEMMQNKYKDALLMMSESESGKAFLSNVPFGKPVAISNEDAARLAGLLSILEKRLK